MNHRDGGAHRPHDPDAPAHAPPSRVSPPADRPGTGVADITPRVAALTPLDRSGLRVRVVLDDGTWLEAATEAVERARVGAGDPLDTALRARLVEADVDWQVREAALDLIARRPYGREELRRRLLRRGFPAATVDACLSALEARGLVDDAAFARSFVRDRLRLRPRGKRRLTQEMREKGIHPSTGEAAVEEAFAQEKVAEAALAAEAAVAWLRRQSLSTREALARSDRAAERVRALRRLNGFLARRGFTGEAARGARAAAVEAARAGPSLNRP